MNVPFVIASFLLFWESQMHQFANVSRSLPKSTEKDKIINMKWERTLLIRVFLKYLYLLFVLTLQFLTAKIVKNKWLNILTYKKNICEKKACPEPLNYGSLLTRKTSEFWNKCPSLEPPENQRSYFLAFASWWLI